ncbi:MAG: efflux RND transporter periplasmic adaptor subunit [Vicinamibacterales bacterium]
MRNRWILAFASLMAIAILSAILARRRTSVTEVDVETVVRVALLQSFVTASGEITAVRSADIGSSIMGRLVDLRVREGDAVRAGQVLATIDPIQAASTADAARAAVQALEAEAMAASEAIASAQAEVEATRARAEDAMRTFARAKDLRNQGLVSQVELDTALANADATRAQLAAGSAALRRAEQVRSVASQRIVQGRAEARRAGDSFSKTRIESPIDGIVTRLNVDEGEMVVMGVQNQQGTILMTISDLTTIDAEVKVSEADVLRLDPRDPATVTLEALPGQRFSGRVVEIGASALPQIGTQAAAREFRVLVRLDPTQTRFRPGLTCDVEILADQRQGALVVPLQAVVERTIDGDTRTGVFAARDGRATFQPLTRTGIIGGLNIEVEGVPEGTRIVAGPIQTLRELTEGARVHVRPSPPGG